MSTLLFSVNSIMPIISVILLGAFIRRIGLVNDDFLAAANKLVFKLAIPTYLFSNVYKIENLGQINWSLVGTGISGVVIVLILGFITTLVYTKDRGKRGSLLQCAFRSNYAIIGIPLAESIGGTEAVGRAAVMSAFSIPFFNIMAVIILTVFSYDNDGKKVSVKDILKGICKNPLIIGVVLGLICLAVRSFIPVGSDGEPIFTLKNNVPWLIKAVNSVGALASPLALLVLGGQFRLSAVKSLAPDIAFGCVWRLVLAPIIGIGLAYTLSRLNIVSLSKVDYPAIIALFATPVAVASAIMAQSMNNHAALSRQLVVWTNVFSMLTIFITIAVCRVLALV
jgi:predicted permease